MREELMLDVVDARLGARAGRRSERASIAIRIRGVIQAGHERTEAAALDRLAGRERERSHRAAVKAAEKGDDVLPSRRIARELEARLDRLGAGVAEKRSDTALDRRDRRELLRQPHLRLVVEVGPRHVQEFLRLLGDRLYDRGMRVAG